MWYRGVTADKEWSKKSNTAIKASTRRVIKRISTVLHSRLLFAKSLITAILLLTCLALFSTASFSQTTTDTSLDAQRSITESASARLSPLLESIEHLACSDTPGSVIGVLENLHQNRVPEWDLPNEWHGVHRPPALLAGTFDLLLNQLIETTRRYPTLQYSVENLMLSWNYCLIQDETAFFNLGPGTGTDKSNPDRTLAHSQAPAQWEGFRSLGFIPGPAYADTIERPIERYVPLGLTRRHQTSEFRENRFWKLYTTQCFPHPDNGSLYYRKMPFGPTAVKGREAQIAQADVYPFTRPATCSAPTRQQDLYAEANEPAVGVDPTDAVEQTSHTSSDPEVHPPERDATENVATVAPEDQPSVAANEAEINTYSEISQPTTAREDLAELIKERAELRAAIANSKPDDAKPGSASTISQKPITRDSPDETSVAETWSEKLADISKEKPVTKKSRIDDRELLINGRAKRLSPIKLQWLNAIKTQKTPSAEAETLKLSRPEKTDKTQTLSTTNDIAENISNEVAGSNHTEQLTENIASEKPDTDTLKNQNKDISEDAVALTLPSTGLKLPTEKSKDLSVTDKQSRSRELSKRIQRIRAGRVRLSRQFAALQKSGEQQPEQLAASIENRPGISITQMPEPEIQRTIVFAREQDTDGQIQFLVKDSFMGGEPVALNMIPPLPLPLPLPLAGLGDVRSVNPQAPNVAIQALKISAKTQRTILFTLEQTNSGQSQFLAQDSFKGDEPIALNTSNPLSLAELAAVRSKRLQASKIRRVQASRVFNATTAPIQTIANKDKTTTERLTRLVLTEVRKRLHPVKNDRTRLSRRYRVARHQSEGQGLAASAQISLSAHPKNNDPSRSEFALARKALRERVYLSKLDKTVINAISPTISLSAFGSLAALANTGMFTAEVYQPLERDERSQRLKANDPNHSEFELVRRALLDRVYLSNLDLKSINATAPVLSLSAFGNLASVANNRIISPDVYYITRRDERGKRLLTRARMWHVILSRSRARKRQNRSWATAFSYLVPTDLSPAARMARRRHSVRVIGETAYAKLSINTDIADSANLIAENTTPRRPRKIVPANNNLYSVDALWPDTEGEPDSGSALEESTRTASTPLVITSPSSNATGLSPVGNIPPNKQSGDSDHFHGFSGTISLNNTQLEFGDEDHYSITSAIAYKPIKDSFFFLRSAVTLNTSDEPLNYTWGFGYDDWHPGTWGFELNNWNPLSPGDGLDLENAVGSLTRKFKGSLLENNNLASSLSLNKSANSEFALTWLISWSPRPNWFVRTLITQSLEGGGTSWAYGFGYNNYRKNTFSLEYNNWGFNETFDTNFRRNAIVTLGYKWEW